jgi:hypothetical protein
MKRNTRIYMNHLVKNPKNAEPVIVLDKGVNACSYANAVDILDENGKRVAIVCWKKEGFTGNLGHEVRAWVDVQPGAKARVLR